MVAPPTSPQLNTIAAAATSPPLTPLTTPTPSSADDIIATLNLAIQWQQYVLLKMESRAEGGRKREGEFDVLNDVRRSIGIKLNENYRLFLSLRNSLSTEFMDRPQT